MERIDHALFHPLAGDQAAQTTGGTAAPSPPPSTYILTECFLLDGTIILDPMWD